MQLLRIRPRLNDNPLASGNGTTTTRPIEEDNLATRTIEADFIRGVLSGFLLALLVLDGSFVPVVAIRGLLPCQRRTLQIQAVGEVFQFSHPGAVVAERDKEVNNVRL